MLRAQNISFFRIMTAGYLSVEAYNAIKPKTRLFELKFDECNSYNANVAKELMLLFENNTIIESLYYLEKLEEELQKENSSVITLFEGIISTAPQNVKEIIEKIGIKIFLLDYVYCSDETFLKRYYITNNNFPEIKDYIHMFQEQYKKFVKTDDNDVLDIENVSTSINQEQDNPMPDTGVSFVSGCGFSGIDICTIDEDAYGGNKCENQKYVIFIYSLNKEEYEIIEDYFIKLLKSLPIRVMNSICFTIGYRDFLVNYLFASEYKLLKLKNFGRKSVFDFEKIKEDLIDFIKEYYNRHNGIGISENVQILEKDLLTEKTLKERIGKVQYAILEKTLQSSISLLSVRSQNGITNYKGDFIEDFIVRRNDIKSLKNIGKKSESEIMSLVNKMSKLVDEIIEKEMNPEQLFIIDKQTVYGDFFDDFSNEFYQKYNHLPMFHILENYLKKELFSSRDLQYLNRYAGVFDEVVKESLDDIAADANLSRERVRQICSSLNNDFKRFKETKSTCIDYHYILNQLEDWQYVIDAVKDNDLLDIAFAKELKSNESTNLSDYFILLIIYVLCKEDFDIIGLGLLPMPTRTKSYWEHSFLINKTLSKSFDFNQLPQLINDIEEDSEEDITLSVEELLLDTFFLSWLDFDTDKVSSVSETLTLLLINEFEKIPNDNFEFTFEGRKKLNPSDIIYKILEDNGDPMTIEELYPILEEKSLTKYKSSQSVKHIVYQDPRLCMVGTGTYVGLIEWKHVKIGGVRDVISQYLAKFNEPVHIGQIIEHVQQYRDSSDNSIRATISSGDQFVQFSGGFYGLKDKTYPRWYYVDESDRRFVQKINDLESFLKSKGHFPFYPSEDSQEELLYRWWNRAKKSTNGKQIEEVKRINSTYSNIPSTKRSYEWFSLCFQYESFVQLNNRKPDKRFVEEKDLDKWFHRTQEDFYDGNLDPNQEKAFIELCKIL